MEQLSYMRDKVIDSIIISNNQTAINSMVSIPGTNNNNHVVATSTENYFGYEECAPTVRRGSMSLDEEKERRASIKAVMVDPNLSPTTKRRSIQHLMDGRRNSSSNGPNTTDSNPVETADVDRKSPDTEYESTTTIQPRCTNIVPICNEQTKRTEQMRSPCPHYERNCTMIAPCCGASFGCRICHDECPVLYVQPIHHYENFFNIRSFILPKYDIFILSSL
jgi:hypothetical protein